MKPTTTAEDLRILMGQKLAGPGLCRVIVRNQTPPSWGLRITKVGTKFFFRDGTEFVDGPHSVNIHSGGEFSTQNNDPGKCVFQEQTFLEVIVPGQPPAILQAIGTCPADECLLQIAHNLVPRASIKVGELTSSELASYVQLVTI
jgi:hypothetical protein